MGRIQTCVRSKGAIISEQPLGNEKKAKKVLVGWCCCVDIVCDEIGEENKKSFIWGVQKLYKYQFGCLVTRIVVSWILGE